MVGKANAAEGNIADDGNCNNCGSRPHEYDPTTWVAVKTDNGQHTNVASHFLHFSQGDRDLQGPETQARHDSLLDEAAARGAFGVPTFFLGERMFWGNDRLMLLEAALGGKAMPEIRR